MTKPFFSTDPMQTIRKLVIKLNKEFTSLIMIQPQTHYGVSIIFNYPIYLIMILIAQSFTKKLFILQEFFAIV